MGLAFHTLDVFTDTRFAGNPLAVVLGADSLQASAMQGIAREFNLSETVFVTKPENPAHSARMRIFTPVAELPFAGHPTVGTAILLTLAKPQFASGEGDALVLLEQGIGTVRAGVKLRPGSAPYFGLTWPVLSALLPALKRWPSDDEVVPSPQFSAKGCRNCALTSSASASE